MVSQEAAQRLTKLVRLIYDAIKQTEEDEDLTLKPQRMMLVALLHGVVQELKVLQTEVIRLGDRLEKPRS